MKFINNLARSYRTYFEYKKSKEIDYFNHQKIKHVILIFGMMLVISFSIGYLLNVLDSMVYIILSMNLIVLITSHVYLHLIFPNDGNQKSIHKNQMIYINYVLIKWMTCIMVYQVLFMYQLMRYITPLLFIIIFQFIVIIMSVVIFVFEFKLEDKHESILRIAMTSLVLYVAHLSLYSLINLKQIHLSFFISWLLLIFLFGIKNYLMYQDRSFNRWYKENFFGMIVIIIGSISYIVMNIVSLYEDGKFLSFWRQDLLVENHINYQPIIHLTDDEMTKFIEYDNHIYIQTTQQINIYNKSYQLEDIIYVTNGYMIETNLGIALIQDTEGTGFHYTISLFNHDNMFEEFYSFNYHSQIYFDYIYLMDQNKSIFMLNPLSNSIANILYFDGENINYSMDIEDVFIQHNDIYVHIEQGHKVAVHQKYGAYTMNYYQTDTGTSIRDVVIQYKGQDYYYVAYGNGHMIYKDLFGIDYLIRSDDKEINFKLDVDWTIFSNLYFFDGRIFYMTGSTFFELNPSTQEKIQVSSILPDWMSQTEFYLYNEKQNHIYVAHTQHLYIYKKVTTYSIHEKMMFIGFLFIFMTWTYNITSNSTSKKGEPF